MRYHAFESLFTFKHFIYEQRGGEDKESTGGDGKEGDGRPENFCSIRTSLMIEKRQGLHLDRNVMG